ncbi:MAG: NUDIX domain-containing protein [Bacteroidetes bacterium]|nr:NUDIX domain-containing protein [Bacteroidota bacterium]
MPHPKFNIRVYGIWIHEQQLLVNEELIRGQRITKLPGGGLHFGEGIIDCLKREWQEELQLEIEVLSHFYTTHFFQPSAFDDSQVISIYYRVAAQPQSAIRNTQPNERTYWLPLAQLTPDTFSLPIDKVVAEMIQAL